MWTVFSFGQKPDSWDLLLSSGYQEGREEHLMMAELGEMTLVCKEACSLP